MNRHGLWRTRTLIGAVLGQRDGDFIQAALASAAIGNLLLADRSSGKAPMWDRMTGRGLISGRQCSARPEFRLASTVLWLPNSS